MTTSFPFFPAIAIFCCGLPEPSPQGLFILLSICGFFSATIGPVLAETTRLIVNLELFNISFGCLMVVMGAAFFIEAPLGGSV